MDCTSCTPVSERWHYYATPKMPVWLWVSLITFILVFNEWTPAFADTYRMPLDKAITSGYVTTSMRGVGGHYGKSLGIEMDNRINDTIEVYLEAGMKMKPADPSRQDVIITRSDTFYLEPFGFHKAKAFAMCGEMNDGTPAGMDYTYKERVRGSVLKVIRSIQEVKSFEQAGQYALWAMTDNASKDELIEHGANEAQLKESDKILKNAGVSRRIFRVRVQRQLPKPADNQVTEAPFASLKNCHPVAYFCSKDPFEEDKSLEGHHDSKYSWKSWAMGISGIVALTFLSMSLTGISRNS